MKEQISTGQLHKAESAVNDRDVCRSALVKNGSEVHSSILDIQCTDENIYRVGLELNNVIRTETNRVLLPYNNGL
jgi:hypothetical protein